MALSAMKVEEGLLAHNFFPRVARRGDEFPPCFVSASFTPKIASKLISLRIPRKDGFGVAAARSTRYDLAPRNFEIAHPRAFAGLARELKASWKLWKHVCTNPSSAIRVKEHEDGRIFSMNTDIDSESLSRPGRRFRAQVDVTNFYSSIYTHSIPWAVYGLNGAKANQNDSSDWSNRLDFKLRQGRRRETTGISTGPGTSAIVGEILMNGIDTELRKKGYDFLRFIDDYFYTADSRDKAEAFVQEVRQQLAFFKLAVHPTKTLIQALPAPLEPRWKREIRNGLSGTPGVTRLLDALDRAIESTGVDPEDGVMRYVLVAIENQLSNPYFPADDRGVAVDRLMNIAFFRPIAVGPLCRLLARMDEEAVSSRAADLDALLREHAATLRSDAMTWLIQLMLNHGVTPSKKALAATSASGDCLALALLASHPDHQKVASRFAVTLEKEDPPDYRRDEYWLVYYQLALAGKRLKGVPQSYYDEFQPLLDANVSFVDLDAESLYSPPPPDPSDDPFDAWFPGGSTFYP